MAADSVSTSAKLAREVFRRSAINLAGAPFAPK
jgi:hypothetical protein